MKLGPKGQCHIYCKSAVRLVTYSSLSFLTECVSISHNGCFWCEHVDVNEEFKLLLCSWETKLNILNFSSMACNGNSLI